jgi:protein arginine kinase activator
MHYRQVINGKSSEAHLCPSCAAELGYNTVFQWGPPNFGFGLDSFLSNMFGPVSAVGPAVSTTCPLCGATSGDISRTGRVGCAECYNVFSSMLSPFISRIHGNTSHTGRIPESIGGKIRYRKKIDSLRAKLQEAVEKQEFERAAELRDEIRKLEGEMGNG